LCLIHEGAPAAVRCLKECGFQDTIAEVARRLRLPDADAEQLLRTQSLVANEVVAAALAEPLDRLERELRRTLGYWQGQTRGVKPQRLILFGGGASLVGIEKRLHEALDLDVRHWTLPHENLADADRLPPAYLLGPALAASALAWEDSWPTA
jgi:Tfp pilus assembly PilM family ATPase